MREPGLYETGSWSVLPLLEYPTLCGLCRSGGWWRAIPTTQTRSVSATCWVRLLPPHSQAPCHMHAHGHNVTHKRRVSWTMALFAAAAPRADTVSVLAFSKQALGLMTFCSFVTFCHTAEDADECEYAAAAADTSAWLTPLDISSAEGRCRRCFAG